MEMPYAFHNVVLVIIMILWSRNVRNVEQLIALSVISINVAHALQIDTCTMMLASKFANQASIQIFHRDYALYVIKIV